MDADKSRNKKDQKCFEPLGGQSVRKNVVYWKSRHLIRLIPSILKKYKVGCYEVIRAVKIILKNSIMLPNNQNTTSLS